MLSSAVLETCRSSSSIVWSLLGGSIGGLLACHASVPAKANVTRSATSAKLPVSATPARTKQAPTERPRVVSIALGGSHTCVLFASGGVKCWGEGRYGALGYRDPINIGDDEPAVAAPDVPIGAPAKAVVAGTLHTCALLQNGQVRCWGPWHSLGFARPTGSQGKLDNSFSGPTEIDLGAPAVEVAAGSSHSCARTVGDAIRCWGRNGEGQLGYGVSFQNDSGVPPRTLGDVALGASVRRIWTSENGSCALLENDRLSCWGTPWVAYSRDRTQRLKSQATPAIVDVGGRVQQVVFGGMHACALLENGSIRCWGEGPGLGLGNDIEIGDDEPPSAVRALDVGGKAVALAAGTAHTCALLDRGAVRCWGESRYGALGYGNRVDIGDDEVPAAAGDVPIGGKALQIAAGGFHTCALLDNDALRCWGQGQNGELGYGNTNTIGDDETPADAGDVPLFANPPPQPATATEVRTPTSRDLPPIFRERPQGSPQAVCTEPCTGCRTLYDSTKHPKSAPVSLTAGERAQVLEVYRQYVTSDHCLADEIHLDPLALGSAQDPGRVFDVLAGAFTEPNRKQKLVLFFAGHCGEPVGHAGGARLRILLENESALHASFDESTASLAGIDLDNDRRTELVAWGGEAWQGSSSSWLAVYSYAGGVQTLLADFPELDSNDCWSAGPEGQNIESKVLYHSDPASHSVCFLKRTRTSACPKHR